MFNKREIIYENKKILSTRSREKKMILKMHSLKTKIS